MVLFELLIALLLGGAVLTALARRIGAPYPVLLALAGTGLALAPIDVPGITLDPDLRAARQALDGNAEPEAALLSREYDAAPQDEAMRAFRPRRFAELRMIAIAIAAGRRRLFGLRANREVGDDTYRAVEEELDWTEGNAHRRARASSPSKGKEAS